MLDFRYKKNFLIFAIFNNTYATKKPGNWDQLYCYRFIDAQREIFMSLYVYICRELWEIFWWNKCWKPSPHTGNLKQINWRFMQRDSGEPIVLKGKSVMTQCHCKYTSFEPGILLRYLPNSYNCLLFCFFFQFAGTPVSLSTR